jgi:nitroreductase
MPVSMPFDVVETDRLLTTTRSVRRRLDLTRPVDRAVVQDCIRVACQAPTAGNAQVWRWVVVTDTAKRATIARLYREAGIDYLERAKSESRDDQTRRVFESALHLADVLHHVPVHVIPCILGRVDPGDQATAADVYGSIVPAAWSFMLALRSRGLGSAWTTIHLARKHDVATALHIPETVTQVALLPVAHTLGDEFRPAARAPAEEVTYWDRWGVTAATSR